MAAAGKKQRRTQTERREEAETRIILAAISLLAERGYDAFTLADVGEAAGYSRGLPAHYFGRKEDLLAQVVRYVVDGYVKSIAELGHAERGLPHLQEMIRQYTRASRTEQGRALVIIATQALVQPTLRDTFIDLNRRGLALFEDEVRAGMKAGNIRRSISVANATRLIYAFLRGQMAFSAFDRSFAASGVVEDFIAALSAHLAPAR